MTAKQDLEGAYTLETPEDSVKLYRGWAETYDEGFAEAHGYLVHTEVARAFHDEGGEGPVLDIGAGTGLVGEALGDTIADGIDISQEMLDVAAGKGLYRNRICADLTQTLAIDDAAYAGFVSAGTFTHGHVGPGCLPELMRIARPGAVYVLSIKEEVFDEAGFGSAFARLVADDAITPLRFRHIRFYAEGAGHDHADDMGLLAIFRRV
ncbi:MAG: methyltransferase domain-containing protein [Pseudomonadota bacterium]